VKQSYVRVLGALAALFVAAAGGILLAGLATYYYLAPTLPDVAALRDVQLQVPLRIYTRDGRLLAQIGEQRRTPVRFAEIPTPLVQAFLAAEDDRFFEHGGIDVAGLARAVLTGGTKGGGSTITMQLARNMFLTPEKQLRRKLREIFLSLRMERQFTKQEILTLYLNKIFLGQRAYGVAAAAEVYYGKTLDQLTLPEIATIAGTTQLPSVLNPISNPERSKQRRAYVLRRMLDKGFITPEQHAAAVDAPVVSQEHGPRVEADAPYVAEMVRVELEPKYGPGLYSNGYRVVTTIDSRLQRSADWAVRAALLEYDRRHGWRGPVARVAPGDADAARKALGDLQHPGGLLPVVVVAVGERDARVRSRGGVEFTIPWETGLQWARRVDARGNLGPAPKTAADVLAAGDVVYVVPVGSRDPEAAYLAQAPLAQGAFVSLDPQDGAITALVGGFDFYDGRSNGRFNRAVQARRQPGSAFKPFVYSGALEHGFTPASIILDAPVVIEGGSLEESWRPENDSGRFYGPTRLRDALARSRNLVSIRLLRALGVDYARDYATRFGFAPEQLPSNLTLALGTASVTPLQMATGYAVFANGGFRVTPYVVERVESADGRVLEQTLPKVACLECPPQIPPPRAEASPAAGPTVSADGSIATTVDVTGATTQPASEAADAQRASVAAVLAPEREPPPFTAGANEAGVTRLADVGPRDPLAPERVATQVISTANAWLMTDLMRDVIRRGTAQRALALQRNDLAGKTGTTNDSRDTWFAGFNADLVATAWVGFDQERSLGRGEEGGRTALPIWLYFMREALAGRPERRLPQPEGIVSARISPTTGELAGADDPTATFEVFLAGRLPGDGGMPGDGASMAAGQQNQAAEEPIF
jgi:penicillin-binding protein 1A